jgi:DNA-directed RNA polymerase subunit RPC12/RpoP
VSTVTFKCPNCGAGLLFNPENQKFHCDYCGSEFEQPYLEQLAREEEQRAAERAKKEEAASREKEQEAQQEPQEEQEPGLVYVCPNCGAELVTDGTTAATFCYFCQNPVVLSGRLTDEYRPDAVLPFTVTKEDAVQHFLSWTAKKKFVPTGFFDKKKISNLSGIYYPYWSADYKMEAKFSGTAEIVTQISTSDEDIITTKHYYGGAGRKSEFHDVMRSALQKQDRKLGDGIHPYKLESLKPFSMAYLTGFFAEKRDIDKDTVRPEIIRELKDYTDTMIREDMHYTASTAPRCQPERGALPLCAVADMDCHLQGSRRKALALRDERPDRRPLRQTAVDKGKVAALGRRSAGR